MNLYRNDYPVSHELIYQLKIRDAMTTELITATPENTLRDIQKLLRDNRITGAPVLDGDKLVGIVCIEDIIKALDKGYIEEKAEKWMTKNIITLQDDVSLVRASIKFEKYNFGRFPVVNENQQLVGIITRGDIVTRIMFELTAITEEIERREYELINQKREIEMTYYNLAHELRRPVAAIEQMLTNIIRGYAGEISEKARDLVNRSKRRCRLDLRATINDILDWARKGMESTESVMTDVRVRDVIEAVLDDAQGIADTKHVIIKQDFPDVSLTVKGDKVDLEKMLKNLLENAVKYTPSEGTVTVSVQRTNDFVKIEIADTGIGIPPDDLDKIFTEFYRSKNARQSGQYGTGLGLAIVNRTVEEHRGNIEVSSELGKGTKFTVLLPVNYQ